MFRHRYFPMLAPALALVLLATACGQDSAAKVRSETTVRGTTSTSSSSTTAAPPPPPTAPLTGIVADAATQARLGRPALAVKIDNHEAALPHDGLNNTDLVMELMVEGISRLVAVYHSGDAGSVGPVRSARSSDPDLLAQLGKPLFGWSGANDTVVDDVHGVPWLVNTEWEAAPKAYRRHGPHSAPHNLYTSTPELFGRAQPGQPAPKPLFGYLGDGETNATGVAAAGVRLAIGDTHSEWVWDAGTHSYLRWEYGRRHATDAGQASATNVVIVQTKYSSGPFARSLGTGKAWVLVDGQVVAGTWERPAREQGYRLRAEDGSPIRLRPGRTWIELPPGPALPLDSGTASQLLAGG